MLSATKSINSRLLRTFLRIRDLSSAATKRPRPRKPTATENNIECAEIKSNALTQPVIKRQVKRKMPYESADLKAPTASSSVRTSILAENSAQASAEKVANAVIGSADPTNFYEHWSLLSLNQAEPVDAHPLLKHVDFSNPLAPNQLPDQITLHRFLSFLRHCHKFKFGCDVIRAQLDKLPPPAILEAARLLADTNLRRRSAARTLSAEDYEDVTALATDLRTQVRRFRLPPSMLTTINTFLNCITNPSETVSDFSADQFRQPIYRCDLSNHLACVALDTEQFRQFRLIMETCPLSPHYSPDLVFHLIDFALRNPKLRKEIAEWYMNTLSLDRLPLNELQFNNYTANVVRVCGSKAHSMCVTKQGALTTVAGEPSSFTVPPEEVISDEDFQCLKEDLNSLLNGLSKESGSVTRKEVAALRQNIRTWSKAGGRAVIVDSLNVFHGALKGFGPLVNLTNRVAAEYENAVLVTRPFLFEKLKNVRWQGKVRIFSCTTLSEDDLLVLLAAMEWGSNAYVLSNDRFATHVERAHCTGKLQLRDWMRRRMLRFNRQDWQYDELPSYGEFVQQVGPKAYFVPVLEETPGIPERSAFLVTC